MKWTNEQYTAIYSRSKRLLVSAAAGSGKTAVLVERVLSRITREHNPDSLDELVILTFTNAAASEMRSRISEAISSALAATPGNRYLRGQLNRVQTARIMTVHAFCAKLVRENFHLLGINPEFRIISGEEEESLRLETLDAFLEKEYASAKEGDPFLTLAESVSGARDDAGLASLVLKMSAILRNDCDPEGLASRLAADADVAPGTDAADTVWGRVCVGALKRDAELAAKLYEKCESLVVRNGVEGAALDVVSAEGANVRTLAAVGFCWNSVRGALTDALKFGRLTFKKTTPEDIKEEIKALRDSAKELLKSHSKGLFAFESEKVVSDMSVNSGCVKELVRLASEFSSEWQKKKLEAGMLGFDDLEHSALGVLSEKKEGAILPSAMAREYGSKIKEIMVDEYQDTNSLQDEIFKCLLAGGAELFVVGDVKQSIYRFRNAEPGIFLARRNAGEYVRALSGEEGEVRFTSEDSTVVMQKNFRSLPSVTESVNAVFRKLMTEDFGEMNYLAGDELVACRIDDSGEDNRTEFDIVVPGESLDEGDDSDEIQEMSARETEAAWIAKRISDLLGSGRKVFDKAAGGYRAIRAGDIAVLVRSARRRVSVISEALSARGIPVNTDAGGDIFSSAEVNAVMSMLSAVDNPGRELALIGYLRSPLEGFSADDLGRVRIAGGGLPFYAAMKSCAGGEGETAEKCRAALQRLEKMRLAASDMDVGRAVGMLLDMSGAFVVFGAMDGGAARRANLNLLTGLAVGFAERGGQELGGFVRSLERSRAHGDEYPAPASGGEGVRLMTVHASKGLEFPVVILANSMERINTDWKKANVLVHRKCGVGMMRTEPERFVRLTTLSREAAAECIAAEQYAEELRLLYVAMTRAREKLIVTGCCEKPQELMVKLKNDGSSQWLGGVCRRRPSFGNWILAACASGDQIPITVNTVSGDQRGECALRETVEQDTACDPAISAEIVRRTSFEYRHGDAVSLPAKMTATGYSGLVELAGESLRAEREIKLPDFLGQRGDLTAAERGVAVHLAMQLLPQRRYTSVADAEGELEILVRKGVLSKRQRRGVSAESVKAFYDSELGARVLDPDNVSVRREFKFSVLAPAERFAGERGEGEKLLLQGVIDLFWVCADGSVELADYKTDAVRPGEERIRAEGYRSQLEVYRYALEEMLKRPVQRAYVWFFRTGRGELLEF